MMLLNTEKVKCSKKIRIANVLNKALEQLH